MATKRLIVVGDIVKHRKTGECGQVVAMTFAARRPYRVKAYQVCWERSMLTNDVACRLVDRM